MKLSILSLALIIATVFAERHIHGDRNLKILTENTVRRTEEKRY